MVADLLKAQAEWNSQLQSQADRLDPSKETVIFFLKLKLFRFLF